MPTSHDVGRIIRDIFYADFPLNPMVDSRNVDLGELRPRRAGDKQLCGDEGHAHEPRFIARKDAEIQRRCRDTPRILVALKSDPVLAPGGRLREPDWPNRKAAVKNKFNR